MKKRLTQSIAMFTAILLLCGCQQAPSTNVITSKNDGVFQERIDQTQPAQGGQQVSGPVSIQCNQQFTSTDGSVDFEMTINREVSTDVTQVVEVKPYHLTEADMKRVAEVLLGDVPFYERRSSSNPQYSKEQYQTMIRRLSPYANQATLIELMGAAGADTYLEYIQTFLESWTEKSETAPVEDPRIPCDWTLKKERKYNDGEVEINGRSIEEDSDVLYANAEKDGIEYIYSVTTRDKKDYKVNRVTLQLTEGLGLLPVDMAIYRSMLCRTDAPTQEQVDAVSTKAQEMLDNMGLGQWCIARVEVQTEQIDEITEYTINVSAVPVLNGVPALYGQPSTSMQDSYAATYQMTGANFQFSANGDLIYFDMTSPLEIVEVRNENVAVLSVEELVEKCQQYLTFSDADSYGLPAEDRSMIEESTGEKVLCQVKINDAEYCLGRVSIQDNDDHYYYIPIVAFKGTVDYISDKTETVFYSNHLGNAGEWVPPLVCINAVDGSIIS